MSVYYRLRDAPPAGMHEGDPCESCGAPVIDSTRELGHLPYDARLFGAMACAACQVFYVVPDDAADTGSDAA